MSTTIETPSLSQVLAIARTEQSPPSANPTVLSAQQKRAANPLFVATFALQELLPKLPFPFPVEPGLPPSPQRRYRCQYRYLGPQPLLDPDQRQHMTDFQIALHLIDFSPLEPLLRRIYRPSHKGEVPYHPVSMFLAVCLRREGDLSWQGLARLLGGDEGKGWRPLFGFLEGQTPSASGLRRFFHAVGPPVFDDLCPQFIQLLRLHQLCPERSTYPGDPEDRGVTIIQDGMLHLARSRPSCQLATDECYRPLAELASPQPPATENPSLSSPQTTPPSSASTAEGSSLETATPPLSEPSQAKESSPPATPPSQRHCRKQENGKPGCACDTPACQQQCQRASRWDPDARFIHYAGHNHKHGKKGEPPGSGQEGKDGDESKGKDVFGYRSTANRLPDDRFACAWTALSNLYSANTDERTAFNPALDKFCQKLPDLKIGEWIDDSAVGYEENLKAIYKLGALRMIDIRAHPNDAKPEVRLARGYDAHGHPTCQHGYPMHPNGYDNQRRRAKWVCRQECRKQPLHEGGPITPVPTCPYLDKEGSLGFTVNIGLTMPDGSTRLARDIPYGSPAWEARYGRRNLAESRNSQVKDLGLAVMPSYGLPANAKEVQTADFLLNLHTLGRLVREATHLKEK